MIQTKSLFALCLWVSLVTLTDDQSCSVFFLFNTVSGFEMSWGRNPKPGIASQEYQAWAKQSFDIKYASSGILMQKENVIVQSVITAL